MSSETRTSRASGLDEEIAATQEWFDSPRFAGVTRLYTARQVVEQRGTIANDYTVARVAAWMSFRNGAATSRRPLSNGASNPTCHRRRVTT